MRGSSARRITERQGSRGLDVLSGVWGAHSAVSTLGKSHHPNLGLLFALDLDSANDAPPAR